MIVAPQSITLPLKLSRESIGRARLCVCESYRAVIDRRYRKRPDNREARNGDLEIAAPFFSTVWLLPVAGVYDRR